jgi:hypothetical protein
MVGSVGVGNLVRESFAFLTGGRGRVNHLVLSIIFRLNYGFLYLNCYVYSGHDTFLDCQDDLGCYPKHFVQSFLIP